jgi:hypothetical protein
MESIGILAVECDDFNNLLTAISGYVKLSDNIPRTTSFCRKV